MKKLLLIILISGLLLSCTRHTGQMVISEQNQANTVIVVGGQADSLLLAVTRELQNKIFQISGAKPAIVHRPQPGRQQIIIGKEMIRNKTLLKKINRLKVRDAFLIKSSGKNVYLAGKNDKADVYAIYTFMKKALGCRMFYFSDYYIPRKKEIVVPEIDKIYTPAFDLRKYFKTRPNTIAYMHWHKLNDLDDWGLFVHAFNKLVPPEKYFSKHPEYFALVGGRRLMDGQLCLSNPEVIKVLEENLRKAMEAHPDKKYWSVSQNDCYNYCQCENCKKLYKKYGSVSGAYIQMANELAKKFPDKVISTLAYQFTRSAPKNIKPLPNVNVMLCSIECDRSKPLADNPADKGFVKDLDDWTKLTQNIFIWDYVVQFKNYLTPFPNLQVLQPNLQLFRRKGIRMAFQQGSDQVWSDLAELKQYLIANLLWNPDVNVDSLIADFMPKYYGPAAKYINAYRITCQNALLDHPGQRLDIYGFPLDYTQSFLTENLLHRYRNLMDSAELAVKNDSVFLTRVQRARLPVDFAYLDIALNGNFKTISFIRQTDSGKMIKKNMLDYLNRFVRLSEKTGAAIINERRFTTEAYKRYALTKLHRMVQKNLLKEARVKLLTRPSALYPAGGARALYDGKLGDMDFHHNWLGFQGNDMVVDIDFKKPVSFSNVDMNFLKAVNSWVFLPEKVIVEVSGNGKTYKKISVMNGDNSDHGYLVKSVPFNLHFSPVKARYVRVKALSMKRCPQWHRGYGNPSWIFIDELIIN